MRSLSKFFACLRAELRQQAVHRGGGALRAESCSTMRPASIITVRLPKESAEEILCVTIMQVMPFSATICFVSASTFSAVAGSSAAVCSSSKSSFGVTMRCHQQCQCLTLAAAQQANRLAKPVFQAKAQRRKLLAERRAVFRTDGGEHAAPLCRAQVGQRHILFNGHVRGRAFQGLETGGLSAARVCGPAQR